MSGKTSIKEKEKGKAARSPEDPRAERKAGSKIVSGEVRQYPPKVGHHGTDDENDLSPEE